MSTDVRVVSKTCKSRIVMWFRCGQGLVKLSCNLVVGRRRDGASAIFFHR